MLLIDLFYLLVLKMSISRFNIYAANNPGVPLPKKERNTTSKFIGFYSAKYKCLDFLPGHYKSYVISQSMKATDLLMMKKIILVKNRT